MNLKLLLVFGLLIIFTVACSSSKESASDTNSNEQEVYIFDDVSEVDNEAISHEAVEVTTTEKVESPTPVAPNEQVSHIVEGGYTVQVGAFSTKEKAENFLRDVNSKIDYNLNIINSNKSGLFVVQLPIFNSRAEAEKVRNELWNIPQFSDAFIVPK